MGSFISAAVTLNVFDSYEAAFRLARKNDEVTRYEPDELAYETYRKQIDQSKKVYRKLNRF